MKNLQTVGTTSAAIEAISADTATTKLTEFSAQVGRKLNVLGAMAVLAMAALSAPAVMHAQANLIISGGVSNSRKFLSANSDGSVVDLWSVDDASGRQRWIYEHASDGESFNIRIAGGISGDRKYLSTTADGTKVDLWNTDDGSGRQRWVFETLPSGLQVIHVKGGVSSPRKYLSVNSDGTTVDLWTLDDGSGRQRWRNIGVSAPPPARTSPPPRPVTSSAPAQSSAIQDADRNPPITVTFFNQSGYVARYTLGYWTGNSNTPTYVKTDNLSTGRRQSFDVPGNTTDFEFLGEASGITSWSTIFHLGPRGDPKHPSWDTWVYQNQRNFLNGGICIKTWGTIFSPQWGGC